MQASLGYFIYPLIAVLIGAFVFGEGMGWLKVSAVGLAALAVLVLTFGLGQLPWISLVLATTFGIYGLIKKRTTVGPVISVTAEVAVIAPFLLIWLLGVHNQLWGPSIDDGSAAFGADVFDTTLLMLSGPLTALPLILFSYAARRLAMATVGLMQYVNPSLQFLVAVLVFSEPFTRWHAIAFPLIWCALALYSLHAIRQERSARINGKSVSTSSAI